jgi:hypothetical protein
MLLLVQFARIIDLRMDRGLEWMQNILA